jgi:hypothetical protein
MSVAPCMPMRPGSLGLEVADLSGKGMRDTANATVRVQRQEDRLRMEASERTALHRRHPMMRCAGSGLRVATTGRG